MTERITWNWDLLSIFKKIVNKYLIILTHFNTYLSELKIVHREGHSKYSIGIFIHFSWSWFNISNICMLQKHVHMFGGIVLLIFYVNYSFIESNAMYKYLCFNYIGDCYLRSTNHYRISHRVSCNWSSESCSDKCAQNANNVDQSRPPAHEQIDLHLGAGNKQKKFHIYFELNSNSGEITNWLYIYVIFTWPIRSSIALNTHTESLPSAGILIVLFTFVICEPSGWSL